MNIRNSRGSMPTWAKVLLGIGIFIIVGICGLGFAGYMFFKNAMTTEPAKVAVMAKDVATFQDPLPAGFKWEMGTNLQFMKMLIAAAPDEQSIILLTVPTAEKTAKELIGDPSVTSNAGAKMTEIEKSGSTMVAGFPMEYRLGTIENRKGMQNKGFMGAIVDKPNNKSLLLVGIQSHGAYNWPETEAFLKGISKI